MKKKKLKKSLEKNWQKYLATTLVFFFILRLLSPFISIVFLEIKYNLNKSSNPSSSSQILEETIVKDYQLIIPKVLINKPIIINVDAKNEKVYLEAIKRGIAHAKGSSLPGNPGLGYYFAHSSNSDYRYQSNAVFYLLGKLELNDSIYIKDSYGEILEYKVSDKKETLPSETEFLHKEYKKETIVLQTCWPPGRTIKRLLVFASKVDNDPSYQKKVLEDN